MGKIQDLKNAALDVLRGKWASFVGLTFVYSLICGVASSFYSFGTTIMGSSFTTLAALLTGVGFLIVILMIPLQYGYVIAHLKSSRQDLPAEIGDLFCGYNRSFGHILGTLLLMAVVVGLGFCLFIIPGIILALAYAFVPYILYDDPHLTTTEVMAKSRAMMKGHKWDLFVLLLSFIGWILLGILTLFIGYLWLMPYMQMTEYKFYERIRADYEQNGDIIEPENTEMV